MRAFGFLRQRAHLGTTTGARLCPKDRSQQVRMPKVAELSQIAWPRGVAAAGAPHTAAVRFRELLVVVSRCPILIFAPRLPLDTRAVFGRSLGAILCRQFRTKALWDEIR